MNNKGFSPWWRYGVLIVFIIGFGVLIWVSATAYKTSPPIPDRVVDQAGVVVFTGDDIRSGQEVFLKHGLMDNGTLWGHGGYLGPDFSATYLHNLVLDIPAEQAGSGLLSGNRYNAQTHTLRFTSYEAESYQRQISWWKSYFISSENTRGLFPNAVSDPEELRQVVAFFSWAAWASAACNCSALAPACSKSKLAWAASRAAWAAAWAASAAVTWAEAASTLDWAAAALAEATSTAARA